MGIELFFILAGVVILVVVLARRRLLEVRLDTNREKLAGIRFESEVPTEIAEIFKKAPALKGDGTYSHKASGTIPLRDNFEKIRINRRLYFAESSEVEVLLIPEPANFEKRLAVAVTLDSKILGYVPNEVAGAMHKYLLAHSSGLRARARIYLGSRAEFNSVSLDLELPLRLETMRKKGDSNQT